VTADPPPDLRERVRALVADRGYLDLLAAVRARMEAHGEAASVTLADLDDGARRALADLLGARDVPGARVRVRLRDLDAALRTSRVAAGLVEVVEAAGGPLLDLRSERTEARRGWLELATELERDPGVTARPEIAAWAEGLRRDGLLARLADDLEDARGLVHRATAVVARLPAGGVALSVLAAQTTGDPHALDHGEALATLVLRAAALLCGGDGVPATPAARRRLWSEVGVVCDPLSTDVLVLGLHASGAGLLARTLGDHAAAGEPVRFTLRALERHPLELTDRVLHVCENPAVVAAAADALGARCAPLVCVEGMPGVAADRLLRAARARGATVHFHADFDWGGLRIGNVLAARYQAHPWRFGPADYQAAVASTKVTAPLRGRPVTPSWDGALSSAMRDHGIAIAEEQLLETLLADLA